MESDILEIDKPREACGVFGIYAPGEDVVASAYLGAAALQHRGQDAAGIAVWNEGKLNGYKDTGLVSEVLTHAVRESLEPAEAAIAHTRYGTVEGKGFQAAQPIPKEGPDGEYFALAHNGHIAIGPPKLSAHTTDSEWFADQVAKRWAEGAPLPQALAETARGVVGAYSIVVLGQGQLIAMRDPNGFRPLELGKLENKDAYVVASESVALDQVGATHLREINPGELVVINNEGVHSRQFAEPNPKLCSFENVYFARPDSIINGEVVQETRFRMGEYLAEQNEVEADMVIGVPNSGLAAAEGFAEASGIPMRQALIKNPYVTRTFIKDNQADREAAVRMKLNPLKNRIAGQRLIIIDDSIVRGTTTKALVSMFRKAGASEIHMKVSSPPYSFPCYYGMDTGRTSELLANRMDKSEMTEYLGLDSLDFLSLDNLQKAIARPVGTLCMACMNGEYPTEIETPHLLINPQNILRVMGSHGPYRIMNL